VPSLPRLPGCLEGDRRTAQLSLEHESHLLHLRQPRQTLSVAVFEFLHRTQASDHAIDVERVW
jgi:hypothetical protein